MAKESENPFKEFIRSLCEDGNVKCSFGLNGYHGIKFESIVSGTLLSEHDIKEWQKAQIYKFTEYCNGIKNKFTEKQKRQFADLKKILGNNISGRSSVWINELQTNIKQYKEKLLLNSIKKDRRDIFSNILEGDPDFYIEGQDLETRNLANKALPIAARHDDPFYTRKLIKYGANVNTIYKGRNTALHIAAKHNQSSYALLALTTKKNINLQNENGDTALHKAVKYDRLITAKNLIDAGADVNAKNKYGDTPLHIAIENKYRLTAKDLIEAGADVNVRSKDGDAPLHIATENKDILTAMDLIDAGADVNAKNQDGYTPIDIARKQNNTLLKNLLDDHKKKRSAVLTSTKKPRTDNTSKNQEPKTCAGPPRDKLPKPESFAEKEKKKNKNIDKGFPRYR